MKRYGLQLVGTLAMAAALSACGGGSKEATIGGTATASDALAMQAGETLSVPGLISTDGITLKSASWAVLAASPSTVLLPTLGNDKCTTVERKDFAPPAGGGNSTWLCEVVVVAPPLLDQAATYTLVLTGIDTRDKSHSVSKTLRIGRSANLDPALFVSAAGADFTVNSGALGTLRCSADGAQWHQWSVTDAKGTAVKLSQVSGPEVYFMAPVVPVDTAITFECKMAAHGRVFSSPVTATVKAATGNTLAITLDGPTLSVRSTTNSYVATAKWKAPSGADVDGLVPTFTWQFAAPVPAAVTLSPGTSTASIAVSNSVTLPALLSLKVVATAGDQSAEARLGVLLEPAVTAISLPTLSPAAQQVKPGAKVSVSATGLGTAQTFNWAVLSGPSVVLGGASTNKVEFVAPAVSVETDLVLRVAVSHFTVSSQAPAVTFLDAVIKVAP